MRRNNIFPLVPVTLLLVLTSLCIPSICPAQSHELVEQYAQQAETLSKQGDNLGAASMFEKSALAMLATPEPILQASAGLFLKAGELYVLAGRDDKAVEAYQQCLQVARKLGQEEAALGVLLDIARVHYRRGQYEKAIEAYQQGLESARSLGKESYEAILLNNIGQAHFSSNHPEEAIEHYREALEIDQRLGNDVKAASRLGSIALAYKARGQHGKAVEHLQHALKVYRELGMEVEIARELNNIGGVYHSQGQYGEAIEHFQQAVKVLKRLGKQAEVAALLNNIGLVYHPQGQYDKAIEYFQEALEVFKGLGMEAEIASLLNNIGLVHASRGQYDNALEHYQQALEINRRIGKETGIARDLNSIGAVYNARNQYDKAIEHYQQALSLLKKYNKEADVATLFNNIGAVYASLGQYDKAIEHYQQALEIDRRLGKEASIAVLLNNIGMVYKSWGQFDKAIDHFHQALEIDRRIGKEASVAIRLNNIGAAYADRSQNDKAIEYYQQALEIDRRLGREADVARDLNNIGLAYHSLGQYATAIEHNQQALEIDRRLGREADVARDLSNIGLVYDSQGQYDKAIEHYQQALETDRRLGKEADVATILNNVGALYVSMGQYDKAIGSYNKSIQLKEKIRKTATGDIRRDYLASQIYTYQSLASAFLSKGDPKGVLDAVEQSRARLLAERIAGIDSEMEMVSLEEVQQGMADDEAILLFSNIDRDNFILMVITAKEMAMGAVSKESFLAKSRKQYKEPILMLLEKQRGLISIENREDEQAFKEKKQQADFETAIHYYRTLLTHPEQQEEAQKFGKLLYALLVEPAGEKLAGKTKVTIMPDGILGFLPFETLVDNNNSYMVQQYDLRYTQSLTIDKLLRNRDYTNKNRRKPLLAMGGAVYEPIKSSGAPIDNTRQLALLQQETDKITEEKRSARSAYGQLGYGNWSNLPGTLEEVNELSSIIKDGDTITGDKVTENRIKQYSDSGRLAQYKVLHFATHGLVVPELPELSAIVLSQFKNEKEGEDGYLRMGEIAKLNLAADFVNLSACETGLGKIVGGEGIVGLTQSFLIAGANGLSVSLWQVADESTAKFMTELYKKVNNTGIGYRQALTEVKRGFINGNYGEQWRSPYYWSPFVYYGN